MKRAREDFPNKHDRVNIIADVRCWVVVTSADPSSNGSNLRIGMRLMDQANIKT